MTITVPVAVKRDKSLRQMFLNAFVKVGPLPPLLLVLIIVFALANERFLSPANILGVSQQSVALLLISIGQMFVLISGGFDLSVGATVALTSYVSASAMRSVYGGQEQYALQSILVGFLVAVVVGAIIGIVNGYTVAHLKVNAFIVTLASSTVLTGLVLVLSRGATVSGLPAEYVNTLGASAFLGIPNLLWLAIPFVILAIVLLARTTYGRHVLAVGSNPIASKSAGISVNRVLILTYLLCSVLAAVAAFALTARSGSGQPTFGATFALESITAAVIGGTSLKGGRGGVAGVILGVIFIAVLGNGMNFMGIDANVQNIALGVALVLAVIADRARDAARRKLISEKVMGA